LIVDSRRECGGEEVEGAFGFEVVDYPVAERAGWVSQVASVSI
jgi:hypothetical protein